MKRGQLIVLNDKLLYPELNKIQNIKILYRKEDLNLVVFVQESLANNKPTDV